jgi:peptide/nickel transport system substrate-binding protein
LPLEEQPTAWGALDQEIMTRYYPGIALYYEGVDMLRGASIHGMNDDSVHSMPTWKDLYIEH